MRNFHLSFVRGIMVVGLLLFTHVLFAQEGLKTGPEGSQNKAGSLIYVKPAAAEQNPLTGKSDVPSSRILSGQTAGTLSSSASSNMNDGRMAPREVQLLGQAGPLNKDLELLPLLSAGCDGKPIGIEDEYAVEAGQSLVVPAPGLLSNDIDPEGGALTLVSVTTPTHGTITSAVTSGSFTYEPEAGFTGTDQFQYTLSDPDSHLSDPVTVTIHVLGSFDRIPLGFADHYGIQAGTALVVNAPGVLANDADPDGDAFTLAIITNPANGIISSAVTSGAFTYTPNSGFTGTDQFQYKLLDAQSNLSEYVTVDIRVFAAFNRKPVGVSDNYIVTAGTALNILAPGVLANDVDPDGDAITLASITNPANGIISGAVTSGAFTYTPNSGFTGTDQFQYKLLDAESNLSDYVTVTLLVVATGSDPAGAEDHYVTDENNPLVVAAPGVLANDVDPGGGSLTLAIITNPANGTISSAVTSGAFTYVPNNGFTGTDQFQYKFLDAGSNLSEYITVTIDVLDPFNRQPIGISDTYGVEAGSSLIIPAPGVLVNDLDPDGDAFTLAIITNPANGVISSAVTSGAFTYTPNSGFMGTDQFQYKLLDAESNLSDYVTVNIEVHEPFNRKPVGVADNYAIPAGTSLVLSAPGVLANDVDPDGDGISLAIITLPANGTITGAVTSGALTYVPNSGFTGPDQFQYKLLDSESNLSDYVTVTINVISSNQPPVASAADDTVECTGTGGTTVTLDGNGSTDPENDALQYSWYENGSLIAGPSASPSSDVQLTAGVHTVTLVVEDACGSTSSDDATVTVEDTSPPVVQAAFTATGHPHEYGISCFAEDGCSDIVSGISVIRIPGLVNPVVRLKNNKNYSLTIDLKKNEVSVEAPDAGAFWSMILSQGGVAVADGQVIDAKYDKNKYQFKFDKDGNLISVKGPEVILWCRATDGYGNTGESEVVLSPEMMDSNVLEPTPGSKKSVSPDDPVFWHRNYPNPFAGETTIEYRIEKPSSVNITVLDLSGRVLEVLVNERMNEGVHRVTWDGSRYNAGIYLYRIESGGHQYYGKLMLQR